MQKKLVGNHAEQVAADRLTEKGLRICDRNRTMRGGELDIVGYLDDLLVVVEVKSIDHVDDLHSYLSSLKISHLLHSIAHRIHVHHWTGPVRLDVVYVKNSQVVERFQDITNS